MQFAFSEDQLAITEAARKMLVETCPPESLRAMQEVGKTRDEDRWATIVEMGLLGMLAPEDRGGMGLGMPDFIGIAEAAGYVALPEPLVELAGVTIPLLAGLDDPGDFLDSAAGGNVVAIGHPANPYVTHASDAIAVVVGDGEDIHIVENVDANLQALDGFDAFRPLCKIDWTPSDATRAGHGWGDTLERGALLAAAQMVGLGQRCIDMAVSYAKDRTQFGKPIGTYQAVKHLLADAQVAIEFARPAVHAAVAEFDNASLAARARISHAKIVSGEAADLAARNALQVFGAMGFTREADLHFFLKRIHGLNQAWGTPARHMAIVRERIATLPTGADATFASELA